MVGKTTRLYADLLLTQDYHDEAFSSWCTLSNSKVLVGNAAFRCGVVANLQQLIADADHKTFRNAF